MAEVNPTTTRDVHAKDQLAKDKEARQRIVEEATDKTEGVKPTPTQEENDRARMGEDVVNKEDDGSGPEVDLRTTVKPHGQHAQSQRSERSEREKADADKQAYATRQQTPKPSGG